MRSSSLGYALIVSHLDSARLILSVEICDSKGEKLHQVLMPKKMARLDESTDYRPFKFRIQAFSNAFHDEVSIGGVNYIAEQVSYSIEE